MYCLNRKSYLTLTTHKNDSSLPKVLHLWKNTFAQDFTRMEQFPEAFICGQYNSHFTEESCPPDINWHFRIPQAEEDFSFLAT